MRAALTRPANHHGATGAPILTGEEAQALLDALDTLDGNGITAVTADLEILRTAQKKLQRIVRQRKGERPP